MAINVSVQYNGGFSPRYDTVDPILLQVPSENLIKCHEEILSSQPMFPPNLNVLTIFPPAWGMLTRFRCVQLFLETKARKDMV